MLLRSLSLKANGAFEGFDYPFANRGAVFDAEGAFDVVQFLYQFNGVHGARTFWYL